MSNEVAVGSARRWRRVIWILVAAVGVIGPVIGLVVVLLAVPDSLRSASPAPSPITMPVTTTEDSKVQPVQATLAWRTGVNLLAPSWTGLVTSIAVHSGSVITSGTTLLSIDGFARIAVYSSIPFYRPLAMGETGPDVQALREALAPLGLGSVGQGGTFDTTLQNAVKRLQARLSGVSASTATGVFDPAWVVFLPQQPVVVGSVDAVVGTTPPAPGQTVVSGASVLDPFKLSPSTASDSASAPLPSRSTGFELDLGAGVTVPLGPAFAVSDPSALAVVAQSVGSQATTLNAEIHLIDPIQLATVPTTSIITDAKGQYCVFVLRGHSADPVYVVPSGGLPGDTEVTGLGSSVETVLANPAQLGMVACKARHL